MIFWKLLALVLPGCSTQGAPFPCVLRASGPAPGPRGGGLGRWNREAPIPPPAPHSCAAFLLYQNSPVSGSPSGGFSEIAFLWRNNVPCLEVHRAYKICSCVFLDRGILWSLGIYLQWRNCFCGLWLNKRIVFGELSKGDNVCYICYLGHTLERDVLWGIWWWGRSLDIIVLFGGWGSKKLNTKTLSSSVLSFPTWPFALRPLRRRSCVRLPCPCPLSRGSRDRPPYSPGTGDGPHGLPYLAARLCLQGALSTSETASPRRPQSPQAVGERSQSEFAG